MKPVDIYKKYFGQIMNNKSLLVILLIGVVLLVLAGMPETADKKTTENKNQAESISDTEYIKHLEQRLAKILSSVNGASDVSVMITLEDSGQSIYARDEKSENKTSDGGSETYTSDGSYVLKNNSGGGQSAVLIKSRLPSVSGVLITAKGADSAEVKNNLISAVKAVLDVGAHRVAVLSK